MAYIYEISFDIHRDQMGDLAIGGSLERVLGYLRTRLPGEPGFVTSQALRSVDDSNFIRMVVWSEWQDWEDLLAHQNSRLIENKVLLEFEPHLKLEHLATNIYSEVD